MNKILCFVLLLILCGCQKKQNNIKQTADLENHILMISNRLSLTEEILRYAILKDTSTNVYSKLLSGEYNARNVLDDKNLELLREKIDTLHEDGEASKYPKIDINNRSIIYGVNTTIGNLLIIVEKILTENGSLDFYVRLINPTSIEILSGQFTTICDTQSENGYKRNRGKSQFNNLGPGESVVLKTHFDDIKLTNIFETKMVIAVRDIRYIDK